MSTEFIRFEARGAGPPRRAPLLERLLARADRCETLTDWRVRAFAALSKPGTRMPAVGSAAALSAGVPPQGDACVYLASPVHLVAGMTSVNLPLDGLIVLEPAAAAELAAQFNRYGYDSGARLWATALGHLVYAVEHSTTDVPVTVDPASVLGADVWESSPRGAGAARLRASMSEIEMWLFDHAWNRARVACGLAPVNGLWLWGGGPTLAALPPIDGWTLGTDPLFASWTASPPTASGVDHGGVVVISARPGERPDETRLLEAALARLRSESIERIELSVGERCFIVKAGWRLRVWRRERPWWERCGIETEGNPA